MVTMDAQWFHDALERAGASQADLARHLGLAQSAVSRMLKGERGMKPVETVQTADFLRVSPEEVLSHLVEDVTPSPAGEAPRRGRPPGIVRPLPTSGSA
ncbi:MAG: helix-turn-helix domain-containing protein, partial [Stellaceae bacterium]